MNHNIVGNITMPTCNDTNNDNINKYKKRYVEITIIINFITFSLTFFLPFILHIFRSLFFLLNIRLSFPDQYCSFTALLLFLFFSASSTATWQGFEIRILKYPRRKLRSPPMNDVEASMREWASMSLSDEAKSQGFK